MYTGAVRRVAIDDDEATRQELSTRFIAAFSGIGLERLPDWFLSTRLATQEEMREGNTVAVETNQGPVPIRIAISSKDMDRFNQDYRGNNCVMVILDLRLDHRMIISKALYFVERTYRRKKYRERARR